MRNHHELVDRLKYHEVLNQPELIAAFRTIDRADFVPPDLQESAYEDRALPIGSGQTISQPYTVAFMFERLEPQPGDKVLDVGSGSAWTTALLAHVVGVDGHVYGVEIVPELVDFGRNNLNKYGFTQAEIMSAGQGLGLPTQAPFNRILVSASSDDIPQELVEQLERGGRMVVSVKSSLFQIDKHLDGQVDTREFPGFAFVPLIQ